MNHRDQVMQVDRRDVALVLPKDSSRRDLSPLEFPNMGQVVVVIVELERPLRPLKLVRV